VGLLYGNIRHCALTRRFLRGIVVLLSGDLFFYYLRCRIFRKTRQMLKDHSSDSVADLILYQFGGCSLRLCKVQFPNLITMYGGFIVVLSVYKTVKFSKRKNNNTFSLMNYWKTIFPISLQIWLCIKFMVLFYGNIRHQRKQYVQQISAWHGRSVDRRFVLFVYKMLEVS
jgi:hypothetical protein